jgi:hypothetical protein
MGNYRKLQELLYILERKNIYFFNCLWPVVRNKNRVNIAADLIGITIGYYLQKVARLVIGRINRYLGRSETVLQKFSMYCL